MHGHERDARGGIIEVIVLIGEQADLVDKIGDRSLFALLGAGLDELPDGAEQLLKVLLAIDAFGRGVGGSIGHQSGLVHDELRKLKGVELLHLEPVLLHVVGKRYEPTLEGRGDLADIGLGRLHDLHHRHALAHGGVEHATEGGGTDLVVTIDIDDALQRLVVATIDGYAEVSYRILDLLALVEAQAAVDAVRDTQLAHLVLKAAALGIGAVEDSYIFVIAPVEPMQTEYLPRHGTALLAVGTVACEVQAFAGFFLRVHLFVDLPFVLMDEAVGGIDDVLRGAVVSLELEESGAGVAVLEVEDILDGGSAEAVDALGIVAYDAHVVLRFGKESDDEVLGVIGVLVLIDEHMPEPLLVAAADVGVGFEQQDGVHEQIIEIHGIGSPQAPVVLGIDGGHTVEALHAVGLGVGVVGSIRFGREESGLGGTDAREDDAGLVDLVVELELTDYLLDQALLVGLVVDGEIVGEAYMFGFSSQDTCTHAVERAHPQVARHLVAHQPNDALLHLARGFVGEGQGEDVSGGYALGEQVSNLIGEHTRLARACSGND